MFQKRVCQSWESGYKRRDEQDSRIVGNELENRDKEYHRGGKVLFLGWEHRRKNIIEGWLEGVGLLKGQHLM